MNDTDGVTRSAVGVMSAARSTAYLEIEEIVMKLDAACLAPARIDRLGFMDSLAMVRPPPCRLLRREAVRHRVRQRVDPCRVERFGVPVDSSSTPTTGLLLDSEMASRRLQPRMPRRRRVGADPAIRTIRVGHALWRARLATQDEAPEAPVDGHEYVWLEESDGRRHFVIVAKGEFERISNYRLRSMIMGLAIDSAKAAAVIS